MRTSSTAGSRPAPCKAVRARTSASARPDSLFPVVMSWMQRTSSGPPPWDMGRTALSVGLQHRGAEGRPRRLGPWTEGFVGEARAGDLGDRVDPEERAGLPEVAEGARRGLGWRPVRRLGALQLEAEP